MNVTDLNFSPEIMSFLKGIDFDIEYSISENVEEKRKEAIAEIKDIRSIRPTIPQIPLWKNKIDNLVGRKKDTIITVLDPQFVNLTKLKINIWNPEYDYAQIASSAIKNRTNTSILENFIGEVYENSFNILYEKFQLIMKFLMDKYPEEFKQVMQMEETEVNIELVTVAKNPDKKEELPVIIDVNQFNKPKYGTKRPQIKELYERGIVSGKEICANLNPPIPPTDANLHSVYSILSQMKKNGEIKVVLESDVQN